MTEPTSNPVFRAFGQALQLILNRVLNLDAHTHQRIATLEGRSVNIEFRGLNVAFRVSVANGNLIVGPSAPSDLRLNATPGSFAAMLLRRNESSIIPTGKVEVAGDVELARQLEQSLRRFDPDLEELLSQTFGDVFGYQLSKLIRKTFRLSRNVAESWYQTTVEYLREESRDLVARTEMEIITEHIDDLRTRADQAEMKLRKFEKLIGGAK